MAPPRFLLSAGEPSGDLHGAGLARALRERWPDAELYGLGGPAMADAGVRLIAHVDQLAVMGFAEVVRHLPYFARLLKTVRSSLDDARPDLVIPIDYPGFNLRLAHAAATRKIPVLYYIAPQVWAWHRSRLNEMARTTDAIAVILPFEEELFRQAGAAAEFVGHPLLDAPRPVRNRIDFCAEIGLDPERPILALFPGSRRQEVERHLELFAHAAREVGSRGRALQPVIARAPGLAADTYRASVFPAVPDGRELLRHARAGIVKSGTTTLEAALAGVPIVIIYRMHPLNFALARRLVRVEHIGLVNLVAGERVMPELVQHDATPAAIADAVDPFLSESHPERLRALEKLAAVRTRLQPPGERSPAQNVASMAARLLQSERS